MAVIDFKDVTLAYPLRQNRGLSLKEFILRRVFRRQRVQLLSTIQALNGVDLHAGEGERIGVIGLNGAGKSTLLRAVAGVYPIASGRRRVTGKICSLFDLSVGMEIEANGWENIRYRLLLQGETPAAIRDMSKPIADFCDLGDFLNYPIRTYSAGMLMRLAFAIATSSDPEILLIDEVFGTGDLAFQKKAEQRMKQFMDRAKIVVMVGHNLGFFEEFCTRILWLDHGRVLADGRPGPTIAAYRAHAEGRNLAA